MKARVHVSLKSTVLDPQGQTVRAALVGLGHRGVKDVRQGKFFDIEIEPGENVETIAREVLINPVIEDFEIEYL
jgi:phosphoribosylformylglycinamidine synthase PurS subunit